MIINGDDICIRIAEQFVGKLLNSDTDAPTSIPGLNNYTYLEIVYPSRDTHAHSNVCVFFLYMYIKKYTLIKK